MTEHTSLTVDLIFSTDNSRLSKFIRLTRTFFINTCHWNKIMFEWMLSYKALKVVSNYEMFILVSY